MIDLDAQRAEAENRLDELKRERGTALLDGRPFDDREINQLQGRIDALAAAEIEAARRNRAVADAHERKRIAEIVAELRIAYRLHREAMYRAQTATGEMADSFLAVIATATSIRQLWDRLGTPPPAAINEIAINRLLGQRIADALRPLSHPGHLGDLVLRSHPTLPGDWASTVPDPEPQIKGSLKRRPSQPFGITKPLSASAG